jgi:hypothetical protein
MLPTASGGLGPEELLARQLRDRPHRTSLRHELPRLFGVFLVTDA